MFGKPFSCPVHGPLTFSDCPFEIDGNRFCLKCIADFFKQHEVGIVERLP